MRIVARGGVSGDDGREGRKAVVCAVDGGDVRAFFRGLVCGMLCTGVVAAIVLVPSMKAGTFQAHGENYQHTPKRIKQ